MGETQKRSQARGRRAKAQSVVVCSRYSYMHRKTLRGAPASSGSDSGLAEDQNSTESGIIFCLDMSIELNAEFAFTFLSTPF